jgi:aminoglycoside phosphotransferase (APT) family kinase protein
VAGLGAAEADVLVHGDLWQGNALWRGDILAGLVDWACAGQGRPDLTWDVLVRRRDAFLRDALGRLDAGRG